MSDSYEDNGEYRPLSGDEAQSVVTSIFTSTAIMSKTIACDDALCDADHDVMVPFLELECFTEGGHAVSVFVPIQLLSGLIGAAAKTIGSMFPDYGSVNEDGQNTMTAPNDISGIIGETE